MSKNARRLARAERKADEQAPTPLIVIKERLEEPGCFDDIAGRPVTDEQVEAWRNAGATVLRVVYARDGWPPAHEEPALQIAS